MAGPGGLEREAVEQSVEELAVIVVSWNDAADLYEAVASLAAARAAIPPEGPPVSLTVIVNGGTQVRREEIVSRWPGAAVVFNRENRGFGPAVNQAALGASAPALLLVNPDARPEGDVFSAVARGFREHPEAVALAPRLLDSEERAPSGAGAPRLAPPGQEDQFTFQLRGLPGLASDARELLLLDHLFPNGAGRRRFRYADADRGRPFEVAQAAAAAFAVRADAFRALAGFDERFVPAWFEDVDLCARLSRLGKILYWPEARFRHVGGLSSRRLGYERFLPIYYRNALALPPAPLRPGRARSLPPPPAGRNAAEARGAAVSRIGPPSEERVGPRLSAGPPPRARVLPARIPTPESRILLRMTDVSIVVVAHDSAEDLRASLPSAAAQRGVEVETIVVDAASRDGSAELARRVHPEARVIALPENVGFSAAMNAGIEASRGRYVLALNPDCRLEPDFSAVLTARLDARPDAGSASGRHPARRGPGALRDVAARLDGDRLPRLGAALRPRLRGGGGGPLPPRRGDRRHDRRGRLLPARGARERPDLDRLLRRGLLPLPRGRGPRLEAPEARMEVPLRAAGGRLSPAAQPPVPPAQHVGARQLPLGQESLPPADQQPDGGGDAGDPRPDRSRATSSSSRPA